MRPSCWRTCSQKVVALLLCGALSSAPAVAQQSSSTQRAGQIGAVRTNVTRNTVTAQVKEELRWNDLLESDSSGRARANLLDGSVLSLGSNTQLRVLEHNGASQQTSLELNYGRLRSRVVKLAKPGAKYEVKTPHAVIGVIGTDFYVFVDSLRTLVIVFSGRVVVKQLKRSDQDPRQLVALEPGTSLDAGQMLEVRAPGPPGAPPPTPPSPQATPTGVRSDAIESTLVDERPPAPTWTMKRKILVITGIAAAVLTPLIIVATGGDRECSVCSSTSTGP